MDHPQETTVQYKYFLGVDVGGSKTHALVADETGQALGFGKGGPGSWEGVGYDGLTEVLKETTTQALKMAGIRIQEIAGAGMGMAGFDWPSQLQAHLDAIAPTGLQAPVMIVNDATLGILAGAEEGWGVSVCSGTGCNCRGWSKDHQREGRVVGGGFWCGESAGAFDFKAQAMQAAAYEWVKRGPATALTQLLIQHTGAINLDDLVEGVYLGRYAFGDISVMQIFQVAAQNDPAALDIMRWAGHELGMLAVSVINQLDLHQEVFDVVLIGSLFDGHSLITESMRETVNKAAPQARLVRLHVPPVVGGVLLGMEAAGLDFHKARKALIQSTARLLNHEEE